MKPTQNTQYITVQGDTLLNIAGQAYGDPQKWPLIADLNQSQITISESEVIPTGTALLIPADTDLQAIRSEQLSRGLE